MAVQVDLLCRHSENLYELQSEKSSFRFYGNILYERLFFFQSKCFVLSFDCRRECKWSRVDTSLDTKTLLFNLVSIQPPQCARLFRCHNLNYFHSLIVLTL